MKSPSEMTAREIIEVALLKCEDPNNAPFPLLGYEAALYLAGKSDAYRHALEMFEGDN